MSGISANQEQQIKELATEGNKIAAIKLYREATSTSLAEAKDAVEAMMRGESVTFPTPAQVGASDPFLEDQIKSLLAERKKIEAVKIYREAYRCGLKEAKDAVDLIQAEMRREGYSGMLPTPAISTDPFAEDGAGSRMRLIIFVASVLALAGALVFFFVLQGGG
jgi:ribosomal protein L7/L12